MKIKFILSALICLIGFKSYSQDSLLVKGLSANRYEFGYLESTGFKGSGWDSLMSEANKNQYFLVGEVHGINEVPLFLDALTKQVEYQTFVAEIDPFLDGILQDKIKNSTAKQLQKWYQQNGGNLSFYSYQKDFDLLKTFNQRNINVIGIDQITALNDIPVYRHLSELTTDKKRKKDYLNMANTAEQMFAELLKDQSKPPYLMSPQFQKDISHLNSQNLSAQEQEIIEKLEYSRQIYTSRDGHQKRIRLMKNQLMDQYEDHLLHKKALFRFGANHAPKGESFLTIYDIGNLASNLAESQLNSSYHLAIFSKAGEAGNPLKGQPNTSIKQLQDLSVFYDLSSDEKWTYYDLKPIRNQLEAGKLKVENEFSKRVIKGYDGLLIIPESTAGVHTN